MKTIIGITFLAYIVVVYGCGGNKLNNTGNQQFNTVKTGNIQSEDSLVIVKNKSTRTEIEIPPEHININAKIRKTIAHIADTNNIYEIHHFDDHHLVHIWDQVNGKNSGIIFVNKNLIPVNYVCPAKINPYQYKSFEVLGYDVGFETYNIKGYSKKEIESKIPDIKWDNKGNPEYAYIRGDASTFSKNKNAIASNFLIVGTEGSMAAKSMIYIIDKYGFKIDSIERIGEEVWHPRVTDDGKYLAYMYGRAYPDGEEGKVVQHFVIYDIESKDIIHREMNFTTTGSTIGYMGNFFFIDKWLNNKNYKIIYDPNKKKIYKIDEDANDINKWGSMKEEGVYDINDSAKRLLSWSKDFEISNFKTK